MLLFKMAFFMTIRGFEKYCLRVTINICAVCVSSQHQLAVLSVLFPVSLYRCSSSSVTMETRFTRGKSAILERPLSRPKTEVSVSAFALLFSEVVQYCQSRVYSVTELQNRLAELGQRVGASLLDVLVLREKNGKRETKVLNILLFIKVG